MIFRIVILTGARKGQQVTVPAEGLVIGRGAEASLRLDDSEIALTHALLEQTEQGLYIRDLGSMGKLLVSNREVRECLLKHGDTIDIGRTRLLVQAVVEVEVRDPRGNNVISRRRRFSWRPLLAALILLAVSAIYVLSLFPDEPSFPPSDLDLITPDLLGTNDTGDVGVREPPPPVDLVPELTGVSVPPPATTGAPPPPETGSTPPPANTAPPAPPPATTMATMAPPLAPPPATTAPPPVDAAALAREVLATKVEGLMIDYHARKRDNRLGEADALLASIQRLSPDYLPAYAERAWLYEEQGLLRPALDQWSAVVQRGDDDARVREARSQLARLERARVERVGRFGNHVRVLSAEQKKFPETDGVREMRLLTVQLQPRDMNEPLNAAGVRVEVRFYDRVGAEGRIEPTRATVSGTSFGIPGSWRDGETKAVTATYAVPAGAAGAAPRAAHFFGFVVRVYYFDALQDAFGQPQALLEPAATGRRPAGDNLIPE